MPRLFWKLFIALWVSIMVFTLLTAWVNATLIRHGFNDLGERSAQFSSRRVDQMERLLNSALQNGGPEQMRELMQQLPGGTLRNLYVYEPSGKELLGRESRQTVVRKARRQHVRKELIDATGGAYQMVVLRRPPPSRVLEPGVRGIVHRLLLTGLMSAVLSFFLARYLTRPLRSLGQASKQLAEGNLGGRVGAPLAERRDEFGDLARDFDHMAANLERAEGANHQLLRDVSHELRSPLARQRVALELARTRDGGIVAAELDRIELESERLEKLVDEVLDLLRQSSSVHRLQREPFDLSELLEDLVSVVSYEIPDGSPAIVSAVVSPLPITGNRELLWRVFENLLRNALLHTAQQAPVELHAAVATEGNQIVIEVKDGGAGLPEAELEKIFTAFYRSEEARDRASGGHGLGLAIAAAAVNRHQGKIYASNRSSGGLVVTVRLPLTPA